MSLYPVDQNTVQPASAGKNPAQQDAVKRNSAEANAAQHPTEQEQAVPSALASDILVSVCVVTYNHGKYIGTCLEHILKQQRDFRIEILIHDDASTDGAQDVIRAWQKRYPDIIKPILRVENQYSQGITNISGAFNFPRAVGKYVALTDGMGMITGVTPISSRSRCSIWRHIRTVALPSIRRRWSMKTARS